MSQPSLKPLISRRKIHKRVKELGREISANLTGSPLTILALMDGAYCFVADLAREIDQPDITLRFIRATSYGRRIVSSGQVKLEEMPDLRGRTVLIVDDILDTGRTLQAAKKALGDTTVYTCVLLNKPMRRVPDGLQIADFIGFTIPDVFVVGYGLDLDGHYRHLPDIHKVISDS
jgi:hypoxanthine phosphoribosyltransferase